MMRFKLWHDDVRPPPRDHTGPWHWARTNKDAIWFLMEMDRAGTPVQEASLDHDLGGDVRDGIDIRGNSPDGDGVDLCFVLYYLKLAPPKVTVHSWNEDGAACMAGILREAGSEVSVLPFREPGISDETYARRCAGWPR